MKQKIIITEEDAKKIKEYRKRVKNKYTDRRMRAVQLLGEGYSNGEAAKMTEADKRQISRWAKKYKNGGVEALDPKCGGRHHQNISYEEEEEILEQFKKQAEEGQIIEVKEIKKAYDEKVGHQTHPTQIYKILHRHDWRKVMPRSKHPKKANEEAIEASKKLRTYAAK